MEPRGAPTSHGVSMACAYRARRVSPRRTSGLSLDHHGNHATPFDLSLPATPLSDPLEGACIQTLPAAIDKA